jgi:acyl transferase domain-containing protein
VLLESAASFGLGPKKMANTKEKSPEPTPRLLPFSAKHPEALHRSVADHESYLSSNPGSLKDMSYSLAMKREVHPHRAFCVTSGEDSFKISRINKPTLNSSPKLVFVFSGQGAQWAQMGKELIQNENSFKKSIQGLDHVLASMPDPPKWKLLGLSLDFPGLILLAN